MVIIATLIATWRWDSPLRLRSVSLDGVFSAFSGINWRFAAAGTDYFQATAAPSPFRHYWSLAVEEQFYVLWPLLLLLVGRYVGQRFGRLKSLLWSLVLIMAVSFYLSATTTVSHPSWAYFGLQTRAWELAAGASIALTVGMWTRMPPAFASQLSWLGIILIGWAAVSFNDSTVYPGTAVALPVLGAVAIIAGCSPGWRHSAEMVLRPWPMQFVGKTSYSWYLWHWPVLMLMPLALGHDLTLSNKWEALVGSFALAVLTYYTVEQPIRRMPVLIKRPSFGLALGAVMAITSLTTGLVLADGAINPPGQSGTAPVVVAAKRPVTLSAIEKAVANGVALKRLPANVRPSLAAAGKDRPYSNGCFSPDDAIAPPPDSQCQLGDPAGAKTLVVVGDSHANEWEPTFAYFAKHYHWKFYLYAKASCPVGIYPGYVDPQTHRLYTNCDAWRNLVFGRVLALKPQVVVMASELRTLAINPDGTTRSIQRLKQSGARVIYLEDTPSPELVGAVPDCLASNPQNIQKCSVARQDPRSRLDAMLQRRVDAGAAKDAGATLMDETQWFCTATVCPPVINGIIVYQDNNHITQTYANYLGPLMGTALKNVIG